MYTLSIPQAILLGAAVMGAGIGTGIYFGLQGRMQAPLPAAAPAIAQAPPVAVKPAPPSGSQLLQQTSAELEAVKPLLAKACPQASGATPDHYMIDYTFNAAGQQIGRGFSEMRGNTHPGLGACLSAALPVLTIPPPGINVNVNVPFSYP